MAGTILTRLLTDTRANTLAVGAAAILPLIGVIGGGVDASRLYLTKARLQQACDSATLAARKTLGGNTIAEGEIPDNIRDVADDFFENNFVDGMYGSENAEFELTAGNATRMDGVATVAVPTTMMGIFGFEEVDLNVECSAELNLPNLDIMLVLDVSGSMANWSGGMTRMQGLQNAVFAFYDEIMGAAPEDAQVRIGMVPYNSAVNVGGVLTAANPDWIADSHTYQSREPIFRLDSNDDGVELGDVISSTTATELLPRDPAWLGSTNQADYRWSRYDTDQRDFCRYDYGSSFMVGGERWVIWNRTWRATHWGSSFPNSQRAACRAQVRREVLAGPDDVRPPTYRQVFDYYRYRPMVFDTSEFKLGNTVSTPTGEAGAGVNSTWNGCIEERAPTIPTLGTTPVDGALDLDIDLIPDPADPDTQWKAQWPQITYPRSGPATEDTTSNRGIEDWNCPAFPARRLQEYPLSGSDRNAEFEAFVNSLAPGGGTIHDSGMLWGARLLSPTGLFEADNNDAPNGAPISRHIIFMTDGRMEPPPWTYNTFGNYNMDGRFFGYDGGGWTTLELEPYHNARLAAICDDVKNKNITVWTITFGLAQNNFTRGCASGENRAFEAANSAALVNAFRLIAVSIAELRLVQ